MAFIASGIQQGEISWQLRWNRWGVRKCHCRFVFFFANCCFYTCWSIIFTQSHSFLWFSFFFAPDLNDNIYEKREKLNSKCECIKTWNHCFGWREKKRENVSFYENVVLIFTFIIMYCSLSEKKQNDFRF